MTEHTDLIHPTHCFCQIPDAELKPWVIKRYQEHHSTMELLQSTDDPHEQENLAEQRPEVVSRCLGQLEAWHQEMMRDHPNGVDPMSTVMLEGGPWHVRGHLRDYLERLRATERSLWAERLAKAHPSAA